MDVTLSAFSALEGGVDLRDCYSDDFLAVVALGDFGEDDSKSELLAS